MCRYFCVSYRQRNRFFKQNWKRAERTQPKSDEGAECELMYDYFHAHNSVENIARVFANVFAIFWESPKKKSAMTILKRSFLANLRAEREADVVNQESELATASSPTVGREFAGPSMRLTDSRQHIWFYELSILSQSHLSRRLQNLCDVHRLMFSRLTGEMQRRRKIFSQWISLQTDDVWLCVGWKSLRINQTSMTNKFAILILRQLENWKSINYIKMTQASKAKLDLPESLLMFP